MKKYNSNEFYEIKTSKLNNNDINVNLWDLEGSNFFMDKNINEFDSFEDFNKTNLNSKRRYDSTKNITKDIKTMKYKNKSVHTSYVKYKNIFDKKNESAKIDFKSKKNKMIHNSFFSNKYEKISFEKNIKEEYKKKARKRFNYSVDYSRNEIKNIDLLSSKNNNINDKKRSKIKNSLSIDTLNNKVKKPNQMNKNISSLKNMKNTLSIKYNNYNRLVKSNSKENDVNKTNSLNIRNINNINKNLYNKFMKNKKELKLTSDKNLRQVRKKNITNKRIIENAEKYTNVLYKKKTFTQNYELQNKLKKEKEEQQAEKELSQCTFQPKLYINKYNNKHQSQKNKNKSIYEKNTLWSNNIKKKKETEREKKIHKEIQGCTFAPQITTLPNYNKKNNISNREIIGEENYYNKMRKARKQIEEKKKGDNLIEKYDERKKKKEILHSAITFGNFNIDKSNRSEENGSNNINNFKLERYSFKNNINDKNNNDFMINNKINEGNINNYNLNNSNINNDINKFSTVSDNSKRKISNLAINTNKFLNESNLKKLSESSKDKINIKKIYEINNGSNDKMYNNNAINIKNMKINNIFQRENNYDFDNNLFEDKFLNKNKSNIINNINFLNPTINYEEKDQEKENNNISTGTVTKANSIISFQKKSTHSLPDRPGNIENLFFSNINDNKTGKNQVNKNITKNKNKNDILQDEDFIRQKKLLMDELHNWSNYDEDSNVDYF